MNKGKERLLPEKPSIVKDFYIGGTHVLIADDYFKDKTKEDIDKTIDRIKEIASDGFYRQQQIRIEQSQQR